MSGDVDVVVIGAGAAGMMCAAEVGKRGRSVLVLDHAAAAGEKIRISGGGKCNFTNLYASPENYISQNPSFSISALKRYSQSDFVASVEAHGISYHEKDLGQLFCDGSSAAIVELLTSNMKQYNIDLRLGVKVLSIKKSGNLFFLELGDGAVRCQSLVIATGGKSIPKMGATGYGYEVAAQFGINIVETRPGLVPLTLNPELLSKLKPLAGISLIAAVASGAKVFHDGMLLTHRGLSGPAILQISSYWNAGKEIEISLLPTIDVFGELKKAREESGRQSLQSALSNFLPKRLAQYIAEDQSGAANLAGYSDKALRTVEQNIQKWIVKPAGSEGYRTAEVTVGGVDTRCLNSTTMESKTIKGLYFIGEVVDVTGWLGGYNFQWAWSSGWCAGQSA